jgi:hypothetical protein
VENDHAAEPASRTDEAAAHAGAACAVSAVSTTSRAHATTARASATAPDRAEGHNHQGGQNQKHRAAARNAVCGLDIGIPFSRFNHACRGDSATRSHGGRDVTMRPQHVGRAPKACTQRLEESAPSTRDVMSMAQLDNFPNAILRHQAEPPAGEFQAIDMPIVSSTSAWSP